MPAKKKKQILDINLDQISLKDLKPLGVPFGSILFLLVLFIVAFNVAFSQIEIQRDEISTAERNVNTLREKINILREFDQLTTQATITSLQGALPNTNSALPLLSQVKKLANFYLLTFSNLNVNAASRDKAGLSRVEMKFDLDGSFEQIIPFLRDLRLHAPISNITGVEFSSLGEIARSTVTVNVYFADFPGKIPSLTDPVNNLTSAEIDTLLTIEELVLPNFVELDAIAPVVRSNPFE